MPSALGTAGTQACEQQGRRQQQLLQQPQRRALGAPGARGTAHLLSLPPCVDDKERTGAE
jgi:hypothetical protein